MSERHQVLFVEDHEPTAAALMERLRSMGFEVLHASTQDEALRLVEQGGFCFAILDLQIKPTAESMDEHVEAGQQVAFEIRGKYPGYNADQEIHWLPIIVLTGSKKNSSFIVRMTRRGVDEYFCKNDAREPLQPSMPDEEDSFGERIWEILEQSGRRSHAGCAEATRRALAKTADAEATGQTSLRLRITGIRIATGNSLRDQVCVGQRQASVPAASFAVLMHLVAGRVTGSNGWVTKAAFGGERGAKRLSDLRGMLKDCVDGVEFDERDGADFRLNQRIDIAVDDNAIEALLAHDHPEVRKLAGRIKAHRASETASPTDAASDRRAIH
jgi:CheY-like chemotaxis protein